MFETETEVTNKITRTEAKGEKRCTLGEDPCLATKKHKLSSSDHRSSQFGDTSLFEDSGEVVVNSTIYNETEIHVIRNDTCKRASFRMQMDDTCSVFSSNYTDSSIPDTYESRVCTPSDGRQKLRVDNAFKGSYS